MMDMENRFDEILRSKIKNFELPYDSQSWDVLQNKMDSTKTLSNEKFDAAIKSKLHNNAEGIPNWSHFETILDTQKQIEAQLYKTKIAEFSLFILLVTAFLNFSALDNDFFNSREKINPDKIRLEKSKQKTENKPNKNYATISPSVLNSYDNRKAITTYKELSNESLTKNTTDLVEQNTGLDREKSTIAFNEKIQNTFENEVIQSRSTDIIYPLQSLVPNTIASANDSKHAIVKPIFSLSPTKGRFKIGIFTGINSYDVTSEIRSKSVNSGTSNDKTFGYTLGATIAYNKEKVAIESGLVYNNINYVPLQVEESPVFNIKELAPVKVQSIQIPLNFKYYLTQNTAIKTYLTAGASLNIALFANYNRDQELSPTIRNNYNEGLFVNGQWKDNYFFATNFGLGIEYKINGFTSAYFQPNATLHTGSLSLGAYNDRINTYSLRAGLKFNL